MRSKVASPGSRSPRTSSASREPFLAGTAPGRDDLLAPPRVGRAPTRSPKWYGFHPPEASVPVRDWPSGRPTRLARHLHKRAWRLRLAGSDSQVEPVLQRTAPVEGAVAAPLATGSWSTTNRAANGGSGRTGP